MSRCQSPKIYEQKLTGLKREVDSSATMFPMTDKSKHKISKKIEYLKLV